MLSFFRSRKASVRKVSVGVCAMDKKARSKPMQEILRRFPAELFDIVVFGDDCILNKPVEEWPVVECLIAFYSTRYPLEKAEKYVQLRKPFLVNDLATQRVLMDRRKVYALLQQAEIEVPRHIVVSRDVPDAEYDIQECDECIVVNGETLNKPFVEKPVDADDHNIYIYYPMSAGGGSKRLFRKVGDRSSDFYPDINEIRRDGSYIYEEFIETQGTDVKVYTVGPDYGHAEARKSPTLDGKVNRDAHGKEVRYPVLLSPAEKEIARKVTLTFKQRVCGFDLLRVQGKSFVCDVNGWSFVKNSRKYYDDCAQILVELLLAAVRPQALKALSTVGPMMVTSARATRAMSDDDSECSKTSVFIGKRQEELRCVIAIVRHGDRTPKQKMKMKVSIPTFLDFFHQLSPDARKDLKVKSKAHLTQFLDITRELLRRVNQGEEDVDQDVYFKLIQVRDVLARWKISGINRKLQMKPRKWTEQTLEDGTTVQRATEVLLILKWGGDLTPLGVEQAENLGRQFRHYMYPDPSGGGVLRLHATFRHDLKIKAGDEGRVMKTAAAFSKGLLELEGDLTPILVSLVRTEKDSTHMLDHSGFDEIKVDTDRCKAWLHKMLQMDLDFTEEQVLQTVPAVQESVRAALRKVGNPRRTLMRIHYLIGNLVTRLEVMVDRYLRETECSEGFTVEVSRDTSPDVRSPFRSRTCSSESERDDPRLAQKASAPSTFTLYANETPTLQLERWRKLYNELYDVATDSFDLTKVPDVHDNIRYDVLHNSHLDLPGIEELYELAKDLADCVVPQEYGIDASDKRTIGAKMCHALLEKIRGDLVAARNGSQMDMRYLLDLSHAPDLSINSLGRRVRTRLYFTSESHLHTLLNVLRYPKDPKYCPFTKSGRQRLSTTSELGYLTHVVIRVFEDLLKPVEDPKRFRVEIGFSPGAIADPFGDRAVGNTEPITLLNKNLTCKQTEECLDAAIAVVHEREPSMSCIRHPIVSADSFSSMAATADKPSSDP